MKKQEKTQQANEKQSPHCGCFEPSSRFGKVMKKIMEKICRSKDNKGFCYNSVMSESNCCSKSN